MTSLSLVMGSRALNFEARNKQAAPRSWNWLVAILAKYW